MREILFRGKRLDDGEWVCGNSIVMLNNPEADKPYDIAIFDEHWQLWQTVDPETVGQYTGLTDKNGKKIFEGDIVRYAYLDEYRCYLESLESPEDYVGCNFDNMWTIDVVVCCINIGYPAFDLNGHDWEVNGLSNLSESTEYYFEVIGNIHDNPELLEVKNEYYNIWMR